MSYEEMERVDCALTHGTELLSKLGMVEFLLAHQYVHQI